MKTLVFLFLVGFVAFVVSAPANDDMPADHDEEIEIRKSTDHAVLPTQLFSSAIL